MLSKGKVAATNAKSPLARIWARIYGTLECTMCSEDLLQKLKWMPAHGAVSTIGRVLDSNGSRITSVEWRANRLVDALAKAAAQPDRVPPQLIELIDAAAEAVEFYAAKLGRVTHEANHYKVDTVLPDGTTTQTTRRDSTAVRQPWNPNTRAKKRRRLTAAGTQHEEAHDTGGITVSIDTVFRHTSKAKRMREDHESRAELCFKKYWQENRRTLRPSTEPPARQRIAELRERVAARQAANTRDTGV